MTTPDRDVAALRNCFKGISLPPGPDFVWVDGHRPFIAAALEVIDEWAETLAATPSAEPDRTLPDWRKPPRYQWTATGMVLDSKGAYVLAHMVPSAEPAGVALAEGIRRVKAIERRGYNPPHPGLVMNDPDAGL